MTGEDHPLTILVVDDDPADALIVREVLERQQIPRNIHYVNGGEQAIDFLLQRGDYLDAPRPDVVLLDLNMPGVDGREVLAVVKGDVKLRRIPIVVLTTSDAPEDIETSYGLGANAYVTKSINLDDLAASVQRIDEFFARTATLPPAP